MSTMIKRKKNTQLHNYILMRVTIDVDEKLRTPYGKYRKAVINELLRIRLKEAKRTKNVDEFKKSHVKHKSFFRVLIVSRRCE